MPNTVDYQKSTTFSIEQKEFYEKALLERMKDELFFYKYAKKTNLPKNHGKNITWRKFLPLQNDPTVPLVEGVTPKFDKLTILEFTEGINQYANVVGLTDVMTYTSVDPVVNETITLLAEQAAETVEKLIVAKLTTSLNQMYAGVTAAQGFDDIPTGATSVLTVPLILGARRILKKLNVKPYAHGEWIWVISPEQEEDLLKATASNASWIDIAKYGNNKKALDGEIGSFMKFRFVVSNNIITKDTTVNTGSAVPVTRSIILGKDSFGAVELEGSSAGKPKIIHKPLGSGGTEDPANQRETLAWKIDGFGIRILNDEAVLVVNTSTSSSSTAITFIDANRSGYKDKEEGINPETKVAITVVKAADGAALDATATAAQITAFKKGVGTGATDVTANEDGSYTVLVGEMYSYTVGDNTTYTPQSSIIYIQKDFYGKTVVVPIALVAK